MRDTLWERLLPQARELIIEQLRRYPATTEAIINTLEDKQYQMWTELPYYVVKMLHERIFNGESLEPIEEEEVRQLFESYYEQ